MHINDFDEIKHFTPNEVLKTGAQIKDVQLELMKALDTFRFYLGSPACLLRHGITTGKHKSPGHPAGMAVDIWTPIQKDYYKVFKAAIDAGFKRVGVYWNGKAYSYHLELSSKSGFWMAIKKEGKWDFHNLINDPKLINS